MSSRIATKADGSCSKRNPFTDFLMEAFLQGIEKQNPQIITTHPASHIIPTAESVTATVTQRLIQQAPVEQTTITVEMDLKTARLLRKLLGSMGLTGANGAALGRLREVTAQSLCKAGVSVASDVMSAFPGSGFTAVSGDSF